MTASDRITEQIDKQKAEAAKKLRIKQAAAKKEINQAKARSKIDKGVLRKGGGG